MLFFLAQLYRVIAHHHGIKAFSETEMIKSCPIVMPACCGPTFPAPTLRIYKGCSHNMLAFAKR